FFFSSRRRHTRFSRDWSSDVCSSDLMAPRDFAKGIEVNKSIRIRIAGMPAGDRDIIVGLITAVPSKHHITKTHAPFRYGKEFVQRNHLSPQYAIYIHHGQLDLVVTAVFDVLCDFF